MDSIIRVAVVGDTRAASTTHSAIGDALAHVGAWRDRPVQPLWLEPLRLLETVIRPAGFDAIWLTSEVRDHDQPELARVIALARDLQIPLLGTGPGAFRATIAAAAGWRDPSIPVAPEATPPSHLRTPTAANDVVRPIGHGAVFLEPGSRAAAAYGRWRVIERYSAERWPQQAERILAELTERRVLRVVGRDEGGQSRVIELPGHPFFVVARFLPQLGSAPFTPAPLARALVDASILSSARRQVRATPRGLALVPRRPAFGIAP